MLPNSFDRRDQEMEPYAQALMNSRYREESRIQEFAFKYRYGKLNTKVAVRKEKVKFNEILPITGVYKDDICPVCKKEVETMEHVMNCREDKGPWITYARRVKSITNSYLQKSVSENNTEDFMCLDNKIDIPLWFFEEKKEYDMFDPSLAYKGYLPSNLRKVLQEFGISQKWINECIQEIYISQWKTLMIKWNRRCRKLFSRGIT
jgi:hypothetical protein